MSSVNNCPRPNNTIYNATNEAHFNSMVTAVGSHHSEVLFARRKTTPHHKVIHLDLCTFIIISTVNCGWVPRAQRFVSHILSRILFHSFVYGITLWILAGSTLGVLRDDHLNLNKI